MRNSLLCLISLAFLLLINAGCTNQYKDNVNSFDNVKICFEVNGRDNQALVLIHGFTDNRTTWNDQVQYFSQKYKVVTIDLPGFGESGNNREVWDMASFARDVVAVINKLNLDDIILVGHSMGGGVIIETAEMIPDQIKGLVLVDIYQDPDFKYSDQMIGDFISGINGLSKIKPTDSTYIWFLDLFKKNSEELAKRFVTTRCNVPTKGWSETAKAIMEWANEECAESLTKVQAPIISINSDEIPTNTEALKKYHPAFDVKIVQNVGHHVHWEDPEQFNKLLEESIQEFLNISKTQFINSY